MARSSAKPTRRSAPATSPQSSSSIGWRPARRHPQHHQRRRQRRSSSRAAAAGRHHAEDDSDGVLRFAEPTIAAIGATDLGRRLRRVELLPVDRLSREPGASSKGFDASGDRTRRSRIRWKRPTSRSTCGRAPHRTPRPRERGGARRGSAIRASRRRRSVVCVDAATHRHPRCRPHRPHPCRRPVRHRLGIRAAVWPTPFPAYRTARRMGRLCARFSRWGGRWLNEESRHERGRAMRGPRRLGAADRLVQRDRAGAAGDRNDRHASRGEARPARSR